jgi:hypothetical protein
MAHGYYNLKGDFVETATKEAATTAWRAERGYSTGGVYDVGGGEVVDTRDVAKPTAPATPQPTYDVQSVQTAAPQDAALYDVQGIQSLAPATPQRYVAPTTGSELLATSGYGTTPSASDFYDIQSIQGTQQQPPQPSGATPTEQAAAQGGGVPEEILPYFADIGSGTQYLWSQWPYNVGGVGTPTELRYGQTDAEGNYAGYGPSSYQWSESPASLAELAQGRTPVAPALAAADTVELFLTEWGVRPDFVTPFVAQSLGLSATDMQSMGYVQDLYGQWIALDFGEESLVGDGAGGAYGGYGGGGGYSSPANFRSGYTSGLINWRIGF